MVSIKDVVRSSAKVPEFDKHLKKVGGNIDRNVVEITIKMSENPVHIVQNVNTFWLHFMPRI